MWNEQGFLRTSIAATIVIAALGIIFGILSGSFSIAFDGVYSLADAAMTGLALSVSSLIVKSAQRDAEFTTASPWVSGTLSRSSSCSTAAC
jgi:predicted Co/Zn/Cd cation transporter (cation efflux family)